MNETQCNRHYFLFFLPSFLLMTQGVWKVAFFERGVIERVICLGTAGLLPLYVSPCLFVPDAAYSLGYQSL